MLSAFNIKWVLIIAAIIGVFCWVSVRPYVDRKQCSQKAIAKVKELGAMNAQQQAELYGQGYLICVNSKGLGS